MAQRRVAFDFERLDVYRRSLDLVILADGLSLAFRGVRRHLGWQLHRAASSIPLNIAEGCGRYRKLDRAQFFVVATGSAMECAAILDIADRLRVGSPDDRACLRSHVEATIAMLISLTRATRQPKRNADRDDRRKST
jgi:four helix bundle protein